MPASRSRFSRYRLPLFGTALAILIGVGIAGVAGVVNLRASNDWIEHTYQVINRIEVADRAVRAAEANARGYRLTGHPDYRSQFLASVPEVDRATDELILLIRDSPAQDARARALRDAARAHVTELQRLYDLQEAQGADAARLATDAPLMLGQWSEIETAGSLMRREELRLLEQRKALSQRRAVYLVSIVALGMLFASGLMAALMWSVIRENRRVRMLERESREAAREMEAAMARVDRLSGQRHALSRYSGMLQSCESRDEVIRLTIDTIRELLPGASGQCYLLRASQDFYESVASFGERVVSSADSLLANDCWALRRGQPHYLVGGHGGPRCDHLDVTHLEGVSSLCVPLVAQGTAVGLLHVSAPSSGDSTDNDAGLIGQIAEQLGLAIANLQLRETLRTQSLRDPLTGLFNRRYLEVSLARELQRCERRGLPLSVLMLDVDHFKRFNDTHGHAAGDALLGQVGRQIQAGVRAEDIACRYGGEEFTVVMPELDAAGSLTRAEQIRRAVEVATVHHLGQQLGPVTLSIGIATFPGDGNTPELLLQMADATLYRAKAEGRNRVLHVSHG